MKNITIALCVCALMLIAGLAHAATVTLNITAGANATAHRIERQVGTGAFSTLATLPMPTVQHVDSTVTVGNNYCYRSVTISAIDTAAPSAPCCVALFAAGSSSVSCTVNP